MDSQYLNTEEPVNLPRTGQTVCGLKRSFIYDLCRKGLIESKLIKPPGSKRGVLVYYKTSLLSYIAKFPSSASAAPQNFEAKENQ